MHLDYLISDLALILIAAGVVTLIFKKIKLPVVLGYIVAGFLISPNFSYMPTVVESADIHVWANIGVVFLMFGLGLEFSFKKLATVGGSAFIVALTVMTAMILIGTGVGSLLGLGQNGLYFLRQYASMSSTMIILKAYEEYNLKNEKFAQLVLSTHGDRRYRRDIYDDNTFHYIRQSERVRCCHVSGDRYASHVSGDMAAFRYISDTKSFEKDLRVDE